MSTIARSAYWLFSAPVDLAIFLGSAVVALAAVALGAALGIPDDASPDWAWVPAVLLIDVAHVWATGFRVYFDPVELRRRPGLYAAVPLIGFVLGVALYSEGPLLFWRVLAYLAVFHFVRQQYGWVALYRGRAGEYDRLGRWIDAAAIYAATLYPLLYWHAHLPRHFWWFLDGDFAALPTLVERMAAPLYWAILMLYVLRSLYRAIFLGVYNPGKDIVVVTTAACWYVGIVACNSDYAFMVTNVIIHGVPYFALVYWHWRRQRQREGAGTSNVPPLVVFFATVWLLAYVEELLWHRGVWHEREWLFGGSWQVGAWQTLLVPLLALPQLTHYVLDGFIWRRRSNAEFDLVPAAGHQTA
jgi:hypothetical protein